VLTQRGAGIRVAGGALYAALHAGRDAGAGALRLACSVRRSRASDAASLTLRSPAARLEPRVELRAPLPRGAGAAEAWAAHGGAAGASLELRWAERLTAAAAVERAHAAPGGATLSATLSADVALGALLPATWLGAQWRSAEPRVGRLRARHTRPPGARLAGTYLSLEARLSADEPFTRRKDLQLLIGRRFLTPNSADEAPAEPTD